MIDEKILQEKILQSEKLDDEELDQVAGGYGAHGMAERNPFEGLGTGINRIDNGNIHGNGGH